eukprot:CAMPEP_0198140266 /NCGR_PEP_ID=MMETSP1443-20131203/3457_1 /TAXON_ID=186043 /ORGANISM="Entomoneis sp., Strain CCMP2396" /LENGTH=247 /DNA_ID=CAMNT_0043802639 /DNA_START=91 /DNA_END=834 /DNA_ORIENTATION=-
MVFTKRTVIALASIAAMSAGVSDADLIINARKAKGTKTTKSNSAKKASESKGCGKNQFTVTQPPVNIQRVFNYANNETEPGLRTAGDFDVFVEEIYLSDDTGEVFPLGPPGSGLDFEIWNPVELVGTHSGTISYLLNEVSTGGPFPTSPSGIVSNMVIDHSELGTGSLAIQAFGTVLGIGVFSIVGGTDDFAGAYGVIEATYSTTVDTNGVVVQPYNTELVVGVTTSGLPVAFGFNAVVKFQCNDFD